MPISHKSITLEHFYQDISKHILLAQNYLELPSLTFLIKSCRLKPKNMMENKNKNLVLHKEWIDEWGNSVYLSKENEKPKRTKIIYNDLSIDRTKLIQTDIYFGLSMEKIAKISKLVFISFGIDEDYYQPSYFLSFLGWDEYLRTYMYYQNEWQQVSSLMLGERNIRAIWNKYKAKEIKWNFYEYTGQFYKLKYHPIPCVRGNQWLCFLPSSHEFITILEKNHGMIAEILRNK